MVERGKIRSAGEYFQGYDHSSWNKVLPRFITPSDIDVVFDNMTCARQMFCEYTRLKTWQEKGQGQRILYQQLLLIPKYSNASVLCTHATPPDRPIDSMQDVVSFHVMRAVQGKIQYELFDTGRLWPEFVKAFFGLENKWGKWWI